MIRIEVTGDSIPEVADKLLAIGSSLRSHVLVSEAAAPGAPAEGAKPKATRKAKEVEPKAADPEPEASGAGATDAPQDASTEQTPATAAETAPPAVELDFDKDVAPVVLDAVQAIGKDKVVELIGEFGAARASEVPPALWPELVAKLKAAQE